MTVWHDKKAKTRTFQPGDEVLLFIPLLGQPLSAKFSGPYRVVKKVSETDYLIHTPDRRKSQQLCHINIMKPYFRPPDSVPPISKSCNADPVYATSAACERNVSDITVNGEDATAGSGDDFDMEPYVVDGFSVGTRKAET